MTHINAKTTLALAITAGAIAGLVVFGGHEAPERQANHDLEPPGYASHIGTPGAAAHLMGRCGWIGGAE